MSSRTQRLWIATIIMGTIAVVFGLIALGTP